MEGPQPNQPDFFYARWVSGVGWQSSWDTPVGSPQHTPRTDAAPADPSDQGTAAAAAGRAAGAAAEAAIPNVAAALTHSPSVLAAAVSMR